MAVIRTNTNLSSISYATAEIIDITDGATLTIDATPATRPGTIQCITSGRCRIVNASPTTPLVLTINDMDNDLRFEGNGVLEIRGAPLEIGTGTNAAQTFDFATLYGGVIPEITYVEVETTSGSGVYMPWAIVHDDPKFNLSILLNNTTGGATPAAFTAGRDTDKVFFWHETNKTLRTAVGFVPSGAKIRIPNIFITNRLLTNFTRVHSLDCAGVPTGGTFTLEILSLIHI